MDYYRGGKDEGQNIVGLERHRHDKLLVVMRFGTRMQLRAEMVKLRCSKARMQMGTASSKMRLSLTAVSGSKLTTLALHLTFSANRMFMQPFVFVFSFPAMRSSESPKDLDMMSFSLVKTFADSNVRSKQMPPSKPKESIHRVAGCFQKLQSCYTAKQTYQLR